MYQLTLITKHNINTSNFINMTLFLILPIIVIIITLINFQIRSFRVRSKLPPGPKQWPLIGNIHQLGNKPHQNIANLSKIYGPIMSLKLGSIPTIVISCPGIAKDMFLKHDLDFSSRKIPVARKVINHDKYSIIWLPVCHKWRALRKIATMQIFTKARLDLSQVLRENKVNEFVDHARNCWENGVSVDIGKAGFTTMLNMMSNTLFSIDLGNYDEDLNYNTSELGFKDLVWGLLDEGSKLNVSDFFPVFEFLDFQGVSRRNLGYLSKMMGIFERIIEERLSEVDSSKDDVLDTLLKLVDDNELSLDDVKHLLMDLFLAGSDTTFSTLEWAMTELLHNPEKMVQAQNELDQVLGKNYGSIRESDISNLPYIQAIVKETLRLHPPAPILIPHRAEKDVKLSGYLVSKNAEVWVNVWAIGRDPAHWENPNLFSPERFLNGNLGSKDFKFIPFGAGRRMCPGMPLAYRMVHLMLSNLVYLFNWKIINGNNKDSNDGENIDSQETFGLSMQRVDPLRLVPIPR